MSLKVLLKLRDASISECETKHAEISKLAKKVRCTRIAGGVTSLVGTTLTIVGFGLVPVTLGGSIALTVLGAGIGLTGGGLSIGSIITGRLVPNKKQKEVNAILKIDIQLTEQFNKLVEKWKSILESIEEEGGHGNREDILALILGGGHLARLSTVAAKTGISGGQLARAALQSTAVVTARSFQSAARGIAFAGVAIALLTVPFDIYEIVSNSIKLHKGSETKHIKRINEILSSLHNEQQSMKQMMDNLTPNVRAANPGMSLEPPAFLSRETSTTPI